MGTDHTISILTHSFLDGYNHQITKIFAGGLERYIYELSLLITQLGYSVEIHQLSFSEAFETHYEDNKLENVRIVGHQCSNLEHIPELFNKMACEASGQLIYASCIWHAIPYKKGSLGICHGINWDRIELVLDTKNAVRDNVQNALSSLSKLVSVDSHFLTYCRSTSFYTDCEKVELIPNFVDTTQFVPRSSPNKGRFRLLYPRRISPERGILQMMAVADILLEKHGDIEIEFAGETIDGAEVTTAFHFWRNHHPHGERIIHNVYTFHEMKNAYRDADLVIIPTIYSEGTSLSCLEALSSGLPVVSSNVGGLNDIIIDGFNGRLVTPTVARLESVISELIQNPDQRKELAANSRGTAMAFDMKRWQKQWIAVLNDYLT
ncbi:glycosyltransferase family 4 protein [Fictibacillus phosphorivorans]|uniref:glycosyltransferase family 4 protein n=1 Tax=Fictibacillus phosphorivorans TaxID=1221500 RepID=UPI0021B3B64E|nr:glycosyltransferase family 4 protein [Fictibacillus phosphorivorans]